MTDDNRAGPIGIGVDIGGTKILACAVHEDGTEIAQASAPSPDGPSGLLAVLEVLFDEVLDSLERAEDVRGVGIALPGLVDAEGKLHAAPNLGASAEVFDSPAQVGRPLAERFAARGVHLDRPVAFENDATCAAIGEALVGAAKGSADTIVISFGTGIGAGILANGQLVRGHRRFAGEIGHVVIDPDGPQCPCGRRGCWEMFASGNALSRLAAQADLRDEDRSAGVALPLDALGLVATARRGDPGAIELIEQFASYIALGLTNVVELLDTGRIVIAGGLANSADVLLEPIRAAFATLSRPSQRLAPEQIVIATLENRAASIGAALLGLGRV